MKTLFTLALVVALSGCASNSLKQVTYDSEGKKETVNYTGYFSGWSYIVDNRIAIEAVVELTNKDVPIVRELQQSVGALGPGDLEVPGSIHVFLYNQTDTDQLVTLGEWKIDGYVVEINRDVDIPAHAETRETRVKLKPEPVMVGRYETSVQFESVVKIGSSAEEISFELARVTVDEMKKQLDAQ